MTERSESERAELVALADWIERSDYLVTPGIDQLKKIVTALRRLAAQDQKPVAWRILCTDKSRGSTGYYYTEQLPFEPGENLRQRDEPVPLYLEPPPAAGWDEAIEACKKVAEKWLESFMGGEVYVARSIVNAIEAIRTPAATKSADAGGGVPDHGGADAGVKAQIATLAQRFWTIHPRELQDKGMTREDFYIREMTALVAAISKPAPVAANASAEARLRDALEKIAGSHWERVGRCQTDVDDVPDLTAEDAMREARKALSTHPHASDCDKQGETTKSEGGEGSPQDGKVGGSEQPYSAGTRQGREIPQSSKPKAECAGSISAAPLPSDRTADVTGYLPIHECYETGDDEVTVVELKTFLDKQWPAPHGDVARALLDAFTVGRR